MVEIMEDQNIEYVDLPMNTSSRIKLEPQESDLEDLEVEYLGDRFCIKLHPSHQVTRAGTNKPTVGSLEEPNISFITYIKLNKSEFLECNVEAILGGRGHQVLWTPPYIPELQPI